MARERNQQGQFTSKGNKQGGITWTSDTLTPGLAKFAPKLELGVRAVMEYHAPQVESYMRANAPWTDRTSNARNGLSTQAVSDGRRHAIVCFHTMPYGPWLEVSNDGRFRIILPTVINQGQEVMATIRGLFRRLT